MERLAQDILQMLARGRSAVSFWNTGGCVRLKDLKDCLLTIFIIGYVLN